LITGRRVQVGYFVRGSAADAPGRACRVVLAANSELSQR